MAVILSQRMDMQNNIWDSCFVQSSAMFGTDPSFPARNTHDPHYGKGQDHGDGLFQKGTAIIHYFDGKKIRLLAEEGFDVVSVEEFREAELPRVPYLVTMRRK